MAPPQPFTFSLAKKGKFTGLSYPKNGMWRLHFVAFGPDLEILMRGEGREGGQPPSKMALSE